MSWVIQKTTTYVDGKQDTSFFKGNTFCFEEYTSRLHEAKAFPARKEARAFAAMYLRKRKCDKIKYIKVER